ncbi:MAG TPA: DUF456 domain-containing protein [Tepidisphaeraceae bacterium]
MSFDWFDKFSWAGSFEWIGYGVLAVAIIAGWLLNILGLPGLWLMVIAHIAFGLATGWNVHVGWWSSIVLVLLATMAEIVEFVAGAAGSAKAGGSKRGMIAAIVGGFVGGIVGSIAIPVPIVGTIIGAVLGSFVGAAMVERLIEADTDRAISIGVGAAKGRFYGIVIKSGFGAVMAAVSLITALPYGAEMSTPTTAPAAPPPTTTTAPAS